MSSVASQEMDLENLINEINTKAIAVSKSKDEATRWIITPDIELDGETSRTLMGNNLEPKR